MHGCWAAAELLPAVSHVLLLCSVCNGEGAWGAGLRRPRTARRGEVQPAGAALSHILWLSGGILSFTVPLLAKHSLAAAANVEQYSVDDGSGGSGGGGNRSCGGSSINGGSSCGCGSDGGGTCGGGAAADPGTPWRQLLLHEMQLTELLGAAGQTLAAVYGCGNAEQEWVDEPRAKLAHVLSLSAAAFPAEFRVAAGGVGAGAGAGLRAAVGRAGGGAGAVAVAGPGEGSRAADGAGEEAEAGARMASGADARAGVEPGVAREPGGIEGDTAGSSTARPCISLAAVHEALRGSAHGEQLGVVDRVLGGWDPTPGEVWDLVCSCCHDSCGLRREQLEALMPLMLPPAEARAAMAGDVAASPGDN